MAKVFVECKINKLDTNMNQTTQYLVSRRQESLWQVEERQGLEKLNGRAEPLYQQVVLLIAPLGIQSQQWPHLETRHQTNWQDTASM